MLYEEICKVVIMVIVICPSSLLTMTEFYHQVMQFMRSSCMDSNPTHCPVLKEKQLCNERLEEQYKAKAPHL